MTSRPLFGLVLLIAAPQASAQVASLEFTPARLSVVAGDSIRLTLVARDRSGTAIGADSAFWGVGPFEVASIAGQGWIRTHRRGSARVVARFGGKTAMADIDVLPKPAAAIELTADAMTVVVGGRTQLRAVARDRDKEPLTDAAISYRSLDPAVASVSPGGVVEAIRAGSARIDASTGAIKSQVTLRVIANPVTSLTVAGPDAGHTGDVLQFRATALGEGRRAVDELTPVWSATGQGGTVYPDGAFVAEKAGAYLVTATIGTRSASATVTIAPRTHDRTVEQVSAHVYSDIQAAEVWAINDVLYVSTGADRLYSYDITDPGRPRLVDSLMVDSRLMNDIATTPDGKIGVLTREGASSRKNGIVFLDLSEPLHPKVLSEYTETVTAGVHSVYIAGHYVYLTDNGRRAMRVIDFQDPKNPKEVAHWEVENSVLAGAGQSASRISPNAAVSGRYLHDIQVVDGLAYLAYFKDGLIILDVGNGIRGGSPTSPKFVSQFIYNTTDFYPPDMLAGTHTIFRFGKYLVVGDEVFPQFFDSSTRDHIRTRGRLHILDVSDITKPKLAAFYEVPEQGSHNVWIENEVMYVGNFEAGLRVVDVSGELRGDLRAQGREIGAVRTASAKGFRPNVSMAWGAQPHKGMIYVSDMNSGLTVARLVRRNVVP